MVNAHIACLRTGSKIPISIAVIVACTGGARVCRTCADPVAWGRGAFHATTVSVLARNIFFKSNGVIALQPANIIMLRRMNNTAIIN